MDNDKYRRRLKTGETLFRQGEHGDCAYVIETGQLEVFRGQGSRRKVLAILGPGELIGEMAVIDHGPRTASAIAKKATRLRIITPEHLQGRVDASDPLVRVLLRLVLKRYRAGLSGKRNRRERADQDRKAALQRLRLRQEIETGLENDQFELYYQPIVRVDTMTIAGFEALARWNHPSRGVVGPAEFVPVMEESGLIHRLAHWVLRKASEAIRRLETQGGVRGQPLFVCVNLSGRDLENPQVVDYIRDALRQSGAPPQSIRIEITESALVNGLDFAVRVIDRCRQLGVQVAVDDFGTGYSSLNYLRHFAVDTLKIDRSFVKPAFRGEDNRKILRTIRDLAHALNMNIVAEGVEDIAQARMIQELGLEYAQGYLLSPPVTEAQAAAMLSIEWPWAFDRRLLAMEPLARTAYATAIP